MAYRPPNEGTARRCQHIRQNATGTNHHQQRVVCLECNAHLAIVWTSRLNDRMKQFLVENLGGDQRRQAPDVPPEEVEALRRDLRARTDQVIALRADMENLEDKIREMETELERARRSHFACCRRRR